MKLDDAFEKIIKEKVLSVHEVLQHLAIVGFPLFDTSLRREEFYEFRVILVVVGVAHMIELPTMLNNLAVVNGNCECSIFGKIECSVFRNSSTSFSVTMMQHFL